MAPGSEPVVVDEKRTPRPGEVVEKINKRVAGHNSRSSKGEAFVPSDGANFLRLHGHIGASTSEVVRAYA
jgi:hypothetical protein